MKKTGKRGQGLVEYALIVTFIAIVSIAVLTGLGSGVTTTITDMNTPIEAAAATVSGS